jgi:hypothetical protein
VLQGFKLTHITPILKLNCIYLRPAKCRVRDETPNLGPRVWYCVAWSGLSHASWGGDRWLWSDGEVMISRRIPKNSDRNQLQCHFFHHESHLVTRDWRRRLSCSIGIRPYWIVDLNAGDKGNAHSLCNIFWRDYFKGVSFHISLAFVTIFVR